MSIDKQILKKQIEATIREYQDACKPENLNFHYCEAKDLESGLCFFSRRNYYHSLTILLDKRFYMSYLIRTPKQLSENRKPIFFTKITENDETILQLHQARIEFLQNILKEIE
jgi:hypothetical protein